MEEHAILLGHVERARDLALKLKEIENVGFDQIDKEVEEMWRIADLLLKSENHYLCEENVLFPYLEKHGITDPPAAMWVEHEKIREAKKNYRTLVSRPDALEITDFVNKTIAISDYLVDALSNHFYKENNVLFQLALKVFTEDEWVDVREGFDDIGYCCFTPTPLASTAEAGAAASGTTGEDTRGLVNFEFGQLLPNQIEVLLDTLPLEVTFIDSNDTVRYFNHPQDRIFIRTKAVIGRQVQQCHPQQSVHLVNQILDDFKSGKRDVAEFWIDFKGRFVHIRFFPVRNQGGSYLGCVEVVQDVTDIKKLEGQKRLL